MNVIQSLISDLREKRLWPIAVALLVALIAVPVLLSGGSNASLPVAQIPPTGSSAAVPALPAVSVTATPSHARLTGKRRDPFTQQVKASTKSSGSKTSTSAKSKASSSSSSTKSQTTSGSVGGTTTTVISTSPTAITPQPTGLKDSEAYHVTVSMTNPGGNLNTIDPVERLSLLPSERQPLLIELGVLKGGHRVLFVVQPGALVRGPGKCTPGPIDCEIVSLAPNQTEWLGTSGTNGVAGVALMAVTAINAANYSSPAAADKARNADSAAGRHLLSQSNLSAISLFRYEPSLGALVDLSNVTVGGS